MIRCIFPVIVLCAMAVTTSALAKCPNQHPLACLPLKYEDANKPADQQKKIYNFMWRSFIALNWPNEDIVIAGTAQDPRIVSGFRGKPHASKTIYDMVGPDPLPMTVWEWYKEPAEVFPEPQNRERFAEWNIPRQRPAGPSMTSGARGLLQYPAQFAEYATDFFQPYFYPRSTGPLIDQNGNYVRYEVAVNQAFFTYVRAFGYFDSATQVKAVNAYIADKNSTGAFVRPPFGNPAELSGYLSGLQPFAQQGLVDVKAAWRELDPADDRQLSRYLHRTIVVDDAGTEKTMGLVALHILRYTPNDYVEGKRDGRFVAATFEQVDNVKADHDPYPGLKPSFNSGAAPNPQQKEYGFEGAQPPPILSLDPKPVDIYRVTNLPADVIEANKQFQANLNGTVFQFYRLIGTQNQHYGKIDPAVPNPTYGHTGPKTGTYTNATNLINTALESYTQKNFSCILCHVRARPLGVPERAFEDDHFKILTFLLQGALPKLDNTDD